jgi:HK97 family phage major capsid protein
MGDTTLATRLNHALENQGKAKQLFDRLVELNDLAKREKRDFTDEEKTEWSEKALELQALREQQKRDESLSEMRAEFADANGVVSELSYTRDFSQMSEREIKEEIGHAARQLLRKKGIAPSIEERDIVMTSGAEGGYILAEEMLMRIMAVNPEREILRPRAMVIPSGDQPNAPFVIPYFDQSTSVAGSLAFAHRTEDGTMSESDIDFDQLKLEAKEQSTYLQVGKKTAVNGAAVSLGTFIANVFLMNKRATEDYLFFQGDGANEPLGLLNCPAKIQVSRDTASTIKFADIAAMYIKMLENGGAIWITNKTAMEDIMSVADSNGNNLIFRPGNIQAGTPNTLLNYPLFETTNVPSLGSEGDLMFVNPNYYLIKDGRPFELTIYDVRPTTQLLDYVGLWDVDAASWVASSITFKDGNAYSPIVVLN